MYQAVIYNCAALLLFSSEYNNINANDVIRHSSSHEGHISIIQAERRRRRMQIFG